MRRLLVVVCLVVQAVCQMRDICRLPLDVMFLQDTTGSFQLDLPNVVKNIPFITHHIEEKFPGSHFGVAEFQDKPYYPLGEPDNVCYKLAGPLSSKMADFEAAYSLLYASGGGDLPEAQYQALIDVVLDPAVGWRDYVVGADGVPLPGSIGGRIVIMSTDAVPHIAGDMAKLSQYPTVPQGLAPNSGLITTDDLRHECVNQDYPSPEQLKNALRSTRTTLIILTPEDPRVAPVWKWVNENLLEQPAAFYKFIEADSSDLHIAVVEILESISHACLESTSTQTPPRSLTTNISPTTRTSTSVPTTSSPSATTTQDLSTSSSTREGQAASRSSSSTSHSPIVPPECVQCPCRQQPCHLCPPQCPPGVLVRFRKEPQHLQVILNNE